MVKEKKKHFTSNYNHTIRKSVTMLRLNLIDEMLSVVYL